MAPVIGYLAFGFVFLIAFGYARIAGKKIDENERWACLCIILALMAAAMIWMSGMRFGTEFLNGKLLPASAIRNKELYRLQPATNVICLTPAKLNGLTALLEPNNSPAYYEAIRAETNSGPVVAIKVDGEMILKAFPVSPEWLKQHTETQPEARAGR